MAPRKEKQGIDIRGPLQIGGSSGTADDVIVGADGGFVPFTDRLGSTWQTIPTYAQKSRAPRKVFCIGIGNSNWMGQPSTEALDRDGVHAPMPGVYEVSRGRDKSLYHAATAGEKMLMRVPNQDAAASSENGSGSPPFSPPGLTPGVGLAVAGPKITALKKAKELLPDIEEIAMLTNGIGSSGVIAIDEPGAYRNVADWAVPGAGQIGQATAATVTEANVFLDANPDYECDWIAMQLGPIAGFAEMTGADFKTAVLALIAYLRANVRRATNAIVTIHGIKQAMVDSQLSASRGVGFGTHQDVQASLFELAGATGDPLGLTRAIDVSDLDSNNADIHHTEAEYTEIGYRHGAAYAQARAARTLKPAYADVRMLPVDGEFKCVLGSGATIHEQRTEEDPVYGTVLRADPSQNSGNAYGFQTDIQFDNAEHTIFARVRMLQDPVGNLTLFGGVTPGQTSYGRLVSLQTFAYQGATGGFTPLLQRTDANGLSEGVWASIALRFDGTNFKAYKDGVATATGTGGGAEGGFVITEPTLLELLTYDNDAATTTSVDARMTDIRVASRALTDAEILAWHNDYPPLTTQPLVSDRTSQLVNNDEVGSALDLGVNPAAGSSWRDQLQSGYYVVSYQNPAKNSTDDGLPWDPNLEGGGVATAQVNWLIQIKCLSSGLAYATATTSGIPTAGGFVSRSYQCILQKLPTGTTWIITSNPAWQELTDGTFS